MKLQNAVIIAALSSAGLMLNGCANTGSGYRPIVDGYEDDAYHADLADCQSLAKTKGSRDGDTKVSALAGAVVGGAFGALEDESLEGALLGALLGGLVGGAGAAAETQEDQKSIVIQCMYGRGHPVVG